MRKAAVSHAVLFPSYTVAFFMLLGHLEGETVRQSAEAFVDRFPAVFGLGTAIWPAANVVNFMYVPLRFRVLYLNIIGVGWNAFLSHETGKDAVAGAGADASRGIGGSDALLADGDET